MYAWEAAEYLQSALASNLQLPIRWTAKGCRCSSVSSSYISEHVLSTSERLQSTMGRIVKVLRVHVGPVILLQWGQQHPLTFSRLYVVQWPM